MKNWLVGLLIALFGVGPTLGPTPTGVVEQNGLVRPGEYGEVRLPKWERQTFNNCGPTTLSMILAYWGIDESPKTLGEKIRPFQHPKGNNDDKTVFAKEFAEWAKKYGLGAMVRPNGDIKMVKSLIANGYPVTVKTLLHDNDDIAHFRIVRGWDDRRQQIIQDDSYDGKNKRIGYGEFLQLWEPFEYGYIVVFPREQEGKVQRIMGEDGDEKLAWEKFAQKTDGFNLVVANYHLGKYKEAVLLFEQIESQLPRRTMWYQIEPILAYQKLENFDRVMQLTDRLLNDGNRAYSELYQIRGEMFDAAGEKEKAKEEFANVLKYNRNWDVQVWMAIKD